MGALDERAFQIRNIDSLSGVSFLKKIILCNLSAFVLACVLLFASAEVWAQTKAVTIISYQKDEVTAEMVEGVREALRTAGFREGRNLKLSVMDAQGVPERVKPLALDMIRGRPDVIIALSLPVIEAVISQTKQIPIVFAGMTDPVVSGVVTSWEPSGNNVTGVSDVLPLQKRVSLIRQLAPQARRVGVIYNPTDAHSVSQVKDFQETLSGTGLIAIELTVSRAVDVGSAARSLIEKADVFQTFLDPTVSQSYAALVQVANDAKIPLIGWDIKDVRAGAVAAVDLTQRDIGVAAGRLALRILRGVKPGAIAPEIIANPPIYVNMQAADLQSVTLTPALSKIVRPVNQTPAQAPTQVPTQAPSQTPVKPRVK
jgi:putative ABC transport system substrate-binding protein